METDSKNKVTNANIDKVFYFIDKFLSESDCFCPCHRCRIDAAALALNTLPPHYFVDPNHSKSSDLGSPWILIEMAVREAMERVLKYPHHMLPITEKSAAAAEILPFVSENTGTDG